jgi:hypothetical protein
MFLGRGSISEYTINLNTLKPTRSSPNQTQLTEQIKKEIGEYREKIRLLRNGGRVSTTKIIGVVLPKSGEIGWTAAGAEKAGAAAGQTKLTEFLLPKREVLAVAKVDDWPLGHTVETHDER